MTVQILSLLGVELVVVLSGAGLAWMIVGWRRRRKRTRALVDFIDQTGKTGPERTRHYHQWLRHHFGLDDEQAGRIAGLWLEAEKGVWRTLVAWQLQPDPKSLTGFPRQLQQLADTWMQTLAEVLPPREQEPPAGPAPSPPNADSGGEEAIPPGTGEPHPPAATGAGPGADALSGELEILTDPPGPDEPP